jgi:membrane fusion protein, multidrug efflux system
MSVEPKSCDSGARTVIKYAIIVFVLLAMVAGIVLVAKKAPADANNAPQAPPEVAVDVSLAVLKPKAMPDAILLPASVEPFRSVTISAEVPGKVERLGAEEGQSVKTGQELVRVDKRTLENALQQAQVSLGIAQTNYDRNKPLAEKGLVSTEEFDKFRAALAVAQTNLAGAKLTLEKSTVNAPCSGVLNRRYIEVGEYVMPGQKLADIVDVSKVKVVVDVPEKDITFLSVGSLMGIMLGTTEDSIVPGTVSYRSVVADPATRTYRVEVTADNKDQKLLPGMIVRMVLLRRMIQNAISVPLFAVIPREGRTVVYIAEGKRAVEREVTLGPTDGHDIQILTGVKAGENLVVEGQRQLKDGQLLNIVKSGGAA